MNQAKNYKQYFTPDKLAEYMVNIVPDENIHTIVDLSMGECGLLEKAKERWKDVALYGADIDEKLIKKINKQSPYICTYYGDSLSEKINTWDEYTEIVSSEGFDLAIANPPFNFFDQDIVEIIQDTKSAMPLEIRFLMKYINIVKSNGYICIIMPYGFLSLDLYRKFRVELLKKVEIINVIKIFEGCFQKIDADTCLVLMQKKSNKHSIQQEIIVDCLNSNYNKTKSYVVDVNKVYRWDWEYQLFLHRKEKIVSCSGLKQDILCNYVNNCRRGKTITKHKEFISEKGTRFIHTTDLMKLYISNKDCKHIHDHNDYFKNSKLFEGEVLIGRVGQGCIGKIGIVTKKYSNMYFSDCILALNIKNINPYYLALYLASDFGQLQLKGIAKGSCSKYITCDELLNICILIPDNKRQKYFEEKYRMLLSKPGRINKDKMFCELINEVNEIL